MNEIANVETLIHLRMHGRRPLLQFVFWNNGCRLTGCDLGVRENADVERLDLRPFVDIHVLVIADSYSPALARFCERVSEYAESVALTVIDWLPDDLGLVWEAGNDNPRLLGDGPRSQEAA